MLGHPVEQCRARWFARLIYSDSTYAQRLDQSADRALMHIERLGQFLATPGLVADQGHEAHGLGDASVAVWCGEDSHLVCDWPHEDARRVAEWAQTLADGVKRFWRGTDDTAMVPDTRRWPDVQLVEQLC